MLENLKINKSTIGIVFLYILFVSAFLLVHRIWFSPDQFFIFALLGAFIIGQARMFLFDWVPFILSYFGYEFMRSVVPFISKNVHIFPMIRFDSFVFGYVPAYQFQTLLYNPLNLQWYDYVSAFAYISHFVMPMVIGFLFWLTDRKIFKEFAIAFLLLSYAGLITFILFPAMPPWMASDMGYLPKISQTLGPIMSHFPAMSTSFPTIYQFVGSDPVAAIPSLHAAFPLLIFLFLVKKFKSFGLIALPYVAAVWFAVLYLGEHYFTDVLIGAFYAIAVFYLVDNWTPIRNYLKNKFFLAKIGV